MPPKVQGGASDASIKTSNSDKKRKKRKRGNKRSRDDEDKEDVDQSEPLSTRGAKRQKLSIDPIVGETEPTGNSQNSSAETPPPPARKRKKKKTKKDRRTKKGISNGKLEAEAKRDEASEVPQKDIEAQEALFPYPTDPDDHCESPLQAYAHIQPLLVQLQSQTSNRKSKSEGLRIYDPYYCNGAVIDNLKTLGFPSVYNKKEDCYQTWASESSYPLYDVFLTNPPYSGDHIEKLVQHITSPKMGNRPWFLLMPDWVHKKDYFVQQMKQKQIQPFYLVPKKRYVYLPPKNYRAAKKSDVHRKSSPFNSFWYIWGGTREQNDRLIQHFYNKKSCLFPVLDPINYPVSVEEVSKLPLSEACDLARSKSAIRDLRRKVKQR